MKPTTTLSIHFYAPTCSILSLLQTVTSALLLHFSPRVHRCSSSSSSNGTQKIGSGGHPEAMNALLATLLFTVTTVTKNKINIIKTATRLNYSFVTVTPATPSTVTLLLQTVTNCYIQLLQTVTAITLYKSIGYKFCNSSTLENRFLRISRFLKYYYY
jgi:Tfp pilus assembly protein FimT